MAIASIVLMFLAPILAQLIYLALSRRREYLADASGALFTRYPEGLASALEKLGAAGRPQADASRVTQPMYIVCPLSADGPRPATLLFATHPPLGERIRILRSMGGAADLGSYDRAHREVTGRRVVGAQALEATLRVPTRDPASEPTSRRQRAREASDAFLSASGYTRVACRGCGALLKLPPRLRDHVARCPRCGSRL